LRRFFTKDVHRPDNLAGAVFDRFDVHERHDPSAVRPFDCDFLVAQSLAGYEDVRHGTFRMGHVISRRDGKGDKNRSNESTDRRSSGRSRRR
jgi:hypothetical protein